MAENSAILGAGMKFPPQVDPATGRFVVASGETSVKESIYIILMTQKTERRPRPAFGASLMSFTFMDTNATLLSIMGRNLAADIAAAEPRVTNINVDISPDVKKNCLIVNISYTVIQTNVRDNLVFPFYLDTTVEEEEEDDYAEPQEV